jgi:hypothetical protein
VLSALKVVMVEPYRTGRPLGKNITKPSRSSRHLCRWGPIPSACVACWPRPSSSTSTRARPGLAGWIRAHVDEILATVERLYGFTLSGGDPNETIEFFHRMAWLPSLLREIEQGSARLDG